MSFNHPERHIGTVPNIKSAKYFGNVRICNFCYKHDEVFRTSSLWLCPDCMKGGYWPREKVLAWPIGGVCDLCNRQVIGYIAHITQADACWRCLWVKLGRKNHALRVGGEHFV